MHTLGRGHGIDAGAPGPQATRMPVIVISEASLTPESYDGMAAALVDKLRRAPGFIAHVAGDFGEGWRYLPFAAELFTAASNAPRMRSKAWRIAHAFAFASGERFAFDIPPRSVSRTPVQPFSDPTILSAVFW